MSEAESEADAEADKSPKPRTENHLLMLLFFYSMISFFLQGSISSFSSIFLVFFTHLACICICKNVTTFACRQVMYVCREIRSGQVRLGLRLLGREGRQGREGREGFG